MITDMAWSLAVTVARLVLSTGAPTHHIRRELSMRKAACVLGTLLLALAAVGTGLAAYPDRPVKLIVPWAAGGDTDNIFRPFTPALQKHLGGTVVIANVGGASGTVGAREAKNAPPGQITVGATLGSTSHFFPALIEKEAKIKLKYVSYEGLAPRMNAILGGHIDLTDSNLTQKGKVDAGQLKFLAIATEKRNPDIPNVPTLKELGVNVVFSVERGIMVPKGTPADVQAKLEGACAQAVKDPAFAESMKKQGTEVRYLDRKAYAEYLKKLDALNKDLARDLGLRKR